MAVALEANQTLTEANSQLTQDLKGISPNHLPFSKRRWYLASSSLQIPATPWISCVRSLGEPLDIFYQGADLSDPEIPRLLDTLAARVRWSIKDALVKVSSLTLGILKSLYPKASLDVVADGWAAGVSLEKADEIVRSFKGVGTKIAAMIGTNPELDMEL